MNRRAAGIVFLLIAAFMYTLRYMSAVIVAQKLNVWPGHFEEALNLVGSGPLYISIAAAIVGIIYLVAAEKRT